MNSQPPSLSIPPQSQFRCVCYLFNYQTNTIHLASTGIGRVGLFGNVICSSDDAYCWQRTVAEEWIMKINIQSNFRNDYVGEMKFGSLDGGGIWAKRFRICLIHSENVHSLINDGEDIASLVARVLNITSDTGCNILIMLLTTRNIECGNERVLDLNSQAFKMTSWYNGYMSCQ